MLQLDDRWVWDFWHVEHDGLHHLYFLNAPRSLDDEHARHWHVTIGHATSTDLRSWDVHDDALAPGPPGSWDDGSTWTGCVVRDGQRWLLFYTGTSSEDGKVIQRIGVATSDDLHTWTKHPDPISQADGEHYELFTESEWHDEAWRDPWVVRGDDDRWHMFVTARANHGERGSRGVIGHAVSDDLLTWRNLPPVSQPAGMGQLEVPQLVSAGDRWAMVFCSDVETQEPWLRDTLGGTGTFYLLADDPFGPYDASDVHVLTAGGDPSLYAGRIIDTEAGERYFLAWLRERPDGSFVGELSDPIPVITEASGRMQLQA